MPVDAVCAMFRSFGGYDSGMSARRLQAPARCIIGDRFPTDIEAIRRVIVDFDAVVLAHTGRFPMLECPQEFNRKLEEIVERLAPPNYTTGPFQ
jgi:pimeloyl-ACP methyl ester carboxylesterase